MLPVAARLSSLKLDCPRLPDETHRAGEEHGGKKQQKLVLRSQHELHRVIRIPHLPKTTLPERDQLPNRISVGLNTSTRRISKTAENFSAGGT